MTPDTEPQPELAFDATKTPGKGTVHVPFPGASTHQPTQELYTDEDGKPVYRDKKPTYVGEAHESEIDKEMGA